MAHTVYACSLQVIDLILAAQPEALVRASADQINLIVDACFKIKQQQLVDHLAKALRKIYVLYPPTSAENPAKVEHSLLRCSSASVRHACHWRSATA